MGAGKSVKGKTVGGKGPGFRPLAMAGGATSAATKSCGECAACCIPYRVPEIDKEAGERCQHILPRRDHADGPFYTGGGCACYHTRPEACRRFHCLWLRDLLPDEMRPDKVGYIVATNWKGGYLLVNELTEGATNHCDHFQAWGAEVLRRGIKIRVLPPGLPVEEMPSESPESSESLL